MPTARLTPADKPKKAGTLDIDWSFLDNIRVLAIEAPLLSMHSLAYFLNEKARWNLGRVADYEGFALMQHTLPEDRLNIFLLENKGEKTFVTGSGSTVDFFLLICGEVAHFDEDEHFNFQALSEMTERIESVFSVYPFDIQNCAPLQEFVLIENRLDF